ncbi:MAG: hypothetical protein HY811_11780 [Planctomycetes bacterium]|nr:hypothetical protein [Planctomycetota bacterium]
MKSLGLKGLKSFSAISLVIANIFPLFAVLFLGWDVVMVLFLYLVESAVICAYGVLKLIIVAKFWAIFVIPLFIFAYGMCLLVPFAIIGGISHSQLTQSKDVPKLLNDIIGGIIAYSISHGISFLWNYIGQKEYRNMTVQNQIATSCERIGVIFFASLAGFFLYAMRETPGQFMLMLGVFLLPVVIILIVHRLKRKPQEVSIVKTGSKITAKRIGIVLISLAILGVLLVSPQISMLIFLIVIKLGADLYSHLHEHSASRKSYPHSENPQE